MAASSLRGQPRARRPFERASVEARTPFVKLMARTEQNPAMNLDDVEPPPRPG
jgi:hypothetical protein